MDELELEAVWVGSVRPALLVAMEEVEADERLAFVLRTVFGVGEEVIAELENS